jgi:hypothetical protein
MNDDFRNKVQAAATQAQHHNQQAAAAGTLEPLYLYARASTIEQEGELLLVTDSAPPPEGYQLQTPEGLRANVSYENYFTWIHERAKRAPILKI